MPNNSYQAISVSVSKSHSSIVPVDTLEVIKLSTSTYTAGAPLNRPYTVEPRFDVLNRSDAYAYFVFHPYGAANGFTGVLQSISFYGDFLERPLVRSTLSLNHDGGIQAVTPHSARVQGRFFSPESTPVNVQLFHGASDGGTEPAQWATTVNVGDFIPGVAPTTFSAAVTGLLPESVYFFRFRLTQGDKAVWSDATRTFITSFRDGHAPLLFSANNIGSHRADLECRSSFSTHTGFVIERATAPHRDQWEAVDVVSRQTSRYINSEFSRLRCSPNNTYFYRVAATNQANGTRSAWSNVRSAITPPFTGHRSVPERIASRSFPSVFQACNPADNPPRRKDLENTQLP